MNGGAASFRQIQIAADRTKRPHRRRQYTQEKALRDYALTQNND
jgi:hypothetical protein